MNLWRSACAALLLVACSSAAHADERILRYLSNVQIQKDGALEVTETIDVRAENDRINHGIYRDFPTRYRGRDGSQVRVGFTFEGATLDGQSVPADAAHFGNGVRIKIGVPETTVSVGEHRYVIRYRTTRQIGRFRDYDELYWNATGNGWAFPIDVAEARILLPSPVAFGQRAAYTGYQGSTDTNAEAVEEKPGEILFRTTSPLEPNQGLTVAAAFPKGVVDEPTSQQKLAWWFLDLLPMVVAALGVAAVAAFLFYAWKRAGRDPRAGTVVPLFSPPDDLSPAAMRYVVEQEVDNRGFAAALVHAGVAGCVRLVEEKGFLVFGGDKYVEGVRDPEAGELDGPEAAAVRRLVSPGERLELDNKNHSTFSSAREALADGYKERFDGKAFNRNYGWAAAAILLWGVCAYLTAVAIIVAEDTDLSIYLAAPPFLAVAAWWLWTRSDSASALAGCTMKGLAFVFGASAFMIGFMAIPAALQSGRWQPAVLIALGLPLALSAFLWISAPTREGRAILDRIAGFRQYLSITERERLDRMQAPADSLQLFERYLPYAIALGVENRWADRFAGQLAAAAAAGQQGFAWYSGSHSPWTDPGGFANSVGGALSSSISSASTAPGSSSGSGGGGSSGGGGGGGGGGGW